MKNITVLILLLFAFLASCSKEKTEQKDEVTTELSSTFDSTALTTKAIDGTEDLTFLLRYKFVPGESFKYRMTTISERQQSIVTDSTLSDQLKQTIIFIINFKTLSVDNDSVAELECTFNSVNLKANANGIDINYQSGNQADSTQKEKFPEYESFVNNSFNLRVGKLGEIVEIYKVDKIINQLLSIRKLSDSLSTEQKTMIQQDLILKTIKPVLAQIFREVPSHKMGKDSTWFYKRESMPIMVFQVDYENQYKIDNLEMLGEDKIAVVSGSIKTNVSGNSSFTEQGVSYKFEKPISTANGKIYFNLDKGRIQKSRSQSEMINAYQMEQGVKKARAKEESSNVNILELL